MDTRVILVSAVAENNVIGKEGQLAFHLPADMYRFKTLTMGHTVLMGRRTWQSFPDRYRPLPGRRNIVLGSHGCKAPGAEVFGSLSEALANSQDQTVFIIGGERVYREALPLADELHLTIVHASPSGDTFFPSLSESPCMPTDHMRFSADKSNAHDFSFVIYRRHRLLSPSPVYLANAREPEQWANMERIELDGACPFCPLHLATYHSPPILCENAHWVVTKNQWPYENTRHHFLVISKQHTEVLADIDGTSWASLGEIATLLEREYFVGGGALALRFGDPAHNRGTVRHLHFHLLQAATVNPSSSQYKPVRIRVG